MYTGNVCLANFLRTTPRNITIDICPISDRMRAHELTASTYAAAIPPDNIRSDTAHLDATKWDNYNWHLIAAKLAGNNGHFGRSVPGPGSGFWGRRILSPPRPGQLGRRNYCVFKFLNWSWGIQSNFSGSLIRRHLVADSLS